MWLQKHIDDRTLDELVAKQAKKDAKWKQPAAAAASSKKQRREAAAGGQQQGLDAATPPWRRRRGHRGHQKLVVGLDFGKVISGGSNDCDSGSNDGFGVCGGSGGSGGGGGGGGDTGWFGPHFLDTPPVPGSEAGVRHLVSALGPANVFVVSKARSEGRRRTLEWLRHHSFCERTGLLPEHVLFTAEKRDKAAVCRFLGITAFVDDLPPVLQEMVGDVPQLLLLDACSGSAEQTQKESNREALWSAGELWGGAPEGMCPIFSWTEVCLVLCGSEP